MTLSSGQPVFAADWQTDVETVVDDALDDAFPTAVSDSQGTSGTTNSINSYTSTLTGGTACGVAFTAPTSGKVLIHNSTYMVNSGANDTRLSFVVREGSTIGSGTSFLAADDSRALIHNGTAGLRATYTHLVTGLTAGASYNVQQAFDVSAGTGTFVQKTLIVVAVN